MHSIKLIDKLKVELGKVIIGQQYMIDRLIIGLLSDGHVLLEGVPGLAKTLTVKSLAHAITAKFNRIQFTPDLLPADIIGTTIYNQQKQEFSVRKGPVFANFILADEINRAPAKVQSALLEAMQERQVTIGEISFQLQEPFLVLATQNPLEQEGTYPLPEAQLDRFMLKLFVDYPNEEEEQLIISKHIQKEPFPQIETIATIEEIAEAKKAVKEIYVDEKIQKYIIQIVFATRFPEKYGLSNFKTLISYGGSPRASIYLALAAKAHAYLNGRDHVEPQDIKSICKDVLRHRIGLSYEAHAEKKTADHIIEAVLNKILTP